MRYGKIFPDQYYLQLIRLANQNGTALEINSRYLEDLALNTDLFSELNPYISIGSDAHRKEDLGIVINYTRNLKMIRDDHD